MAEAANEKEGQASQYIRPPAIGKPTHTLLLVPMCITLKKIFV
jgi:hypothetical protein